MAVDEAESKEVIARVGFHAFPMCIECVIVPSAGNAAHDVVGFMRAKSSPSR